MKKLNLLFIFIFLIFLNLIRKPASGFVSGDSLYNFTINLITGLLLAVLTLVLLRASSLKTNWMIQSLLLSQGVIFYFLFTQPRLFDKILVAGFYFSGIFYKVTNKKKWSVQIAVFLIFFPLIFELTGWVFFGRHFIFLNLLRNFLIMTAGTTAGLFLRKS